jgi:serine/threonine-protein kinase
MAGLSGITLDHYDLIEEIGRGGMSTVCKAIDTRDQSEVAVKVLSPTISGDNRFVRRFKRESSLLADMSHPNIVPVIDYGESKGMVYMVLPFVQGDTLQVRIEKRRIKMRDRERWIVQLADALRFAHEHGIIHRDVKPSNVLIDKSGNALLTDFGLAREVEGSNTLTGSMLLGTPAYMAPEQGRGAKTDARSDQYSFGVILYQLVTGKLPFEADSPMGTVLKHIQEPVPRPSRFVRDMSPALERVILKCLAKDPEYRYPSVGAFYQAYRAAREGASLAELNLDTVAISVEPSIGEEAGAYIPAKDEGQVPRRSFRWLFYLIGVPLVIAGAIFAYPAVSTVVDGIFQENSFPTVVPPAESLAPVDPTATDPPQTFAPPPTPISISSEELCPLGPDVLVFRPEVEVNRMVWRIHNADAVAVEMGIEVVMFPQANDALLEIMFGDEIVWQGSANNADEVTLGENVQHSIDGSSVTQISMEFTWPPANEGYTLILNFDSGCTVEAKW